MKKLLITLTMMMAVGATTLAVAPKHRHDPQAMKTEAASDTAEIVAYSDTTSAATPIDAVDDDNNDSNWNHNRAVNIDIDDPFSLVGYLTTIGIGGVVVAVICVLFSLLLLASPFILIGIIFYLVAKRRNQKYKLVEKAIENGQQIPQSLLHEEISSDTTMWSKGVKNIALGLGLVAFFYFIGAGALVGIGWLVFFYGAGQAVIAKTTKGKHSDTNRHEPSCDNGYTDGDTDSNTDDTKGL